ncbi:MAG: GAF domain-containing protein [Opitutaceae bacterium]|nr:GAF domain-containing protein [Opitutaceae bacterium]
MPEPAADTPHSPQLIRLLVQLMERVTEFLEVERSTIFLFDEEKGELWTPVAQGSSEIRIPRSRGIAAHVFNTGETVYLPDVYADPRFDSSIDRRNTGFITRDMFCRPISDSLGRRIGVLQLLNRRAGPLTPRDEKLLDAICGQAGIAIENAQLFLRLKKVHDSEHALHQELEAKHAELQKAFLKIEESAAAQELLGRRIQKVRLVSMVTTVALFVALGLFAWLGGGETRPGRPAAATGPVTWHTVAARPVRSGIALLGNLEPLEVRNLTAPLRGRIAEKNFQYGELVAKDQLLARLDTTDVEIELRNAEAAHFRASAELARLEDWERGPEVARANRNLLKARLSFEANERNLKEMEQLFQLGIIAQSSLDSARQQFTTQQADYASAREEVDNVLAVATPARLTVARYDVENARLRVAELRDKIARAALHAPFAGIVILPNARPTAGRPANHDGFYEQGSTINQGDILLALGNLEGVAVKTRADEADIARIRHDQPVIITGDAFAGHALAGRVAYVSSQAIATGGRPYFEILIKTGTLTPAELAVVRLGMTARLDITVYQQPAAVVVPVGAVRRTADGAVVYRRGDGERPVAVPVTLGATLPDAVEIVAGLRAGDVVAASARAAAAP